ncbi:MAG: domain S-box-containing protein [Gemmatimonadetes bacterium]|nr:domain S-box-containing protein [Gemmatimonadota bacterium]
MRARYSDENGRPGEDRPALAGVHARPEHDLFAGPGEVRAHARALDWSSTTIGPVAAWAPALRSSVRLMLDSPVAMSLWCGPSYTLVYNDAYARILGKKHPHALGRPGAAVWDELWPAVEREFSSVRAGGPPVLVDEARFTMERLEGGHAEDAWFTYALSALRDETGTCLAVYNVAVEVTEIVRARDKAAGERSRLLEAFERVPSFVSVSDHVLARHEVERLLVESENARSAGEAAQEELRAANEQLQEQGLELEERTEQAESERARATAILETMTDAHFVLDADFRFASVNAASERALFHSREQLLGRSIWEVFPAVVGTIFERSYRHVATARVPVHFIGEYEDDSLDLVPEVDAYPSADGGIAVFWRDIAPRVRGEAALRASEQRLRDVFEQAPIAVAVMTGPEHVYTAVSPLYAKTPGLGRVLLGRAMRDAFPEIAGKGYIEAIDRVYHTGEPFSATERLVPLARPGDGVIEDRYFNLGYQPLRDQEGKVYAVASVAYDVTDQVLARREVEKARTDAESLRAEAEAANAAKSQFLSTMSHELRTPLNAISGYTELLTLELRGPLNDQQRHDLDRIRRASQHLMGLVTDVLNFAKIDAGRVEFHLADVDLKWVVDDIEPLIGPQLAAKLLTFDHDGCASDSDQPLRVRADAEKVRQILLNLLTNAVKFTDAGGLVALSCEKDATKGVVRMRVSDTGRGIPADQIDRIFEPFVQVDRHRTLGSQQGVGLGLAISRDLARAMGGDLSATSELGVGSTFTLVLPAT